MNHRRMQGKNAIKREIKRIKDYERVFSQNDIQTNNGDDEMIGQQTDINSQINSPMLFQK